MSTVWSVKQRVGDLPCNSAGVSWIAACSFATCGTGSRLRCWRKGPPALSKYPCVFGMLNPSSGLTCPAFPLTPNFLLIRILAFAWNTIVCGVMPVSMLVAPFTNINAETSGNMCRARVCTGTGSFCCLLGLSLLGLSEHIHCGICQCGRQLPCPELHLSQV